MRANVILNFKQTDAIPEIIRLTERNGVDVAIEALRTQSTIEKDARPWAKSDPLRKRHSSRGEFHAAFRRREFRPKDFQNNPALIVIDEGKHLRASLTEPIVPNAVDSGSRITF